jgi:putative addiction module killer protein
MIPSNKTEFLLQELLLPDGTSPFSIWFNSLESVAAAKVRVVMARIELGNLSTIQWFRGIGECRIDWGPGLRVYLAKDGLNLILLLGGGDKRRQQKDIDLAVTRLEQHKQQKRKAKKK